MRYLWAVLVAYLGSRAIFSAFDFEYDLFRDPFDVGKLIIDLGKLIIDLGVFVVLFEGCCWFLGLRGTQKSKDEG